MNSQEKTYTLDPRLARDCVVLGRAGLCDILLMDDAQYPWFVLVPRRVGLRELYQLDIEDQTQLTLESNALAKKMIEVFKPHKLNIANLGNVVPQLHIHHIARFEEDIAWPAPVWGKVPALAYCAEEIETIRQDMASLFAS